MSYDVYSWPFSNLGLVSVLYFFHMETQKISIWENTMHSRFSVTIIIIILIHQWRKYNEFLWEVLDNEYNKDLKYNF